MTLEQIAELLDGVEYAGSEYQQALTKAELAAIEASAIIAVGESENLLEIYGLWRDEVEVYEGTEVRVGMNGFLPNPMEDYEFGAEAEECLRRYGFWEQALARYKSGAMIRTRWDYNGHSWWIETDGRYAPFTITEDDEPFCRGIVMKLNPIKLEKPDDTD